MANKDIFGTSGGRSRIEPDPETDPTEMDQKWTTKPSISSGEWGSEKTNFDEF